MSTMAFLNALMWQTDMEIVGRTDALDAQGYWIELKATDPEDRRKVERTIERYWRREDRLMTKCEHLIYSTPADECDRRV